MEQSTSSEVLFVCSKHSNQALLLCAFRLSAGSVRKSWKMFIEDGPETGPKLTAEAMPEAAGFILLLLPALLSPVPGIRSITVLSVPVSLAVRITAV